MKVKYFEDTDILHVQLSDAPIAETKEMNENFYIDLDAEGRSSAPPSNTQKHPPGTSIFLARL
ncbi:MAG: DUF2283 domain-containing protein [Nitrospiria bacterium]